MMSKFGRLAALSITALAAGGLAAQALEVKLQVTEIQQVPRAPAVITTGVPFAKGAVQDAGKLGVSIAGKPVPAQFIKTVPWDDGSVRWALMDVQAPVTASGKVELVVSDAGRNPAPPAPMKVDDGAEAVKVSAGPLQFSISKKKPGLFESLKVDGKELLTAAGRGLVLVATNGQELAAAAPDEVKVEQAGPMRAMVCVKGKFPGVHNELLKYTARISAFSGQKRVKVHLWLENHGAMGYFRAKEEGGISPTADWFAFKGLAVECGLGLGPSVAARCEDAAATNSLKVLQVCRMAKGQAKDRRGPFYTVKDFEYLVTSAGQELKKGDRTDGVLTLKGEAGTLTAVVRDFWQNYEKAIETDGKTLKLWLWPTEGQWPRPRGNLRSGELFDRTLQAISKDKLYLIPGAVHKGHEFTLDFSGRDPKEIAAELCAPLFALASAEYYATTEAAPGVFAPPEVRTADRDCNAKLTAWGRMARLPADPANPANFYNAREYATEGAVGYFQDSTYWYGWMDFGDLFVPGRGQVSLHYDWIWLMLLNAMRTGDPACLRLGGEMARHRIDIDQFWSDRDLPEVRGLQRGDHNYPSFHCNRIYNIPGVSQNWLAGVALYYMLTGEPKALECCQRNAEGLKAGWAWVAQNKPYGGPQGDMAANAWSMNSYCAMYRLTADKKWLDEALGLFTAHVVPKWKSQGPFLHDPARQIQQQDYIQEDMKYCHSLASFCELHHLTGDETVFKLLTEGCEKPFPDSFFEAPLFLADLYAYVGLKKQNPEYLVKAADSFGAGFPMSKCPPVYLPDNGTWSRMAAMTLRTGHLLQYAFWKQSKDKK